MPIFNTPFRQAEIKKKCLILLLEEQNSRKINMGDGKDSLFLCSPGRKHFC